MPEEAAVYAVSEMNSRGRVFAEEPHRWRTDFERDRDRIIYCSAFRRLEGKTQVFTPGLDDYYRTRLTHSIEVAQIGRTIARALGLNETLTEAICLAHDLGHSPFGHTGETALNELTAEFGGFEHNLQSLRVVDLLEHPYPDFMGLNLMYETRLGLARHTTPYDAPQDDSFSEVNCSVEGQVADMADRIAVNSHDLEDGLRARVINDEQLKDIALYAEAQSRANVKAISDGTIRRTRTAKAIIDKLVGDCIDQSINAIAAADLHKPSDVYECGENVIMLSSESLSGLKELEGFLMKNFYLSESVMQVMGKVKAWLGELFEALCRDPQLMPGYFQKFIDEQGLERSVCDYIAGMTDRFCLKILSEVKSSK
ncbi:MAG: deoxyguanosinetriphosphate triphosphohydrolase [Planctomycetota bacterium]|jgi:dGTPase